MYRMNADGFGHRLTDQPDQNFNPSWSAGGKKIAFNSERPATDGTTDYDIWRMRVTDGANPTNLTNNTVIDFDPEWQPVP